MQMHQQNTPRWWRKAHGWSLAAWPLGNMHCKKAGTSIDRSFYSLGPTTEKACFVLFFLAAVFWDDAADQQTSVTLRWCKHVGGPRCTEAPTHAMTYKQTQKIKMEQRTGARTRVMCPCLRFPVKYNQPQEGGAPTCDCQCILGSGTALPALAS